MEFNLDPSSGFADSYLDVEFSVKTSKHYKSIINIRNETSGDDLQILGASSGYILDGSKLVLKNKTSTTGHINVFNYDKMNKKFLTHRKVVLKCTVEFYNDQDDKTGEEEELVTFYNEMHSLDAGIIPFDLIVHDKTVDITNNEALVIDIISDLAKNYELCISSLDEKNRCHIEISARQGKTTVEIPGEFLYHDLELGQNKKKFQIFYVMHQGTTVSRMSNRRYFPIQETDLDFKISGGLSPVPQMRLDPANRLIDTKFIISSRYLVMCPRERSRFAGKSNFSPAKMMDFTMLVNESQHMNSLSKQMQQFSTNTDQENIQHTQKALHLERQAKQQIRRPKITTSQIQLMKSVSGAYDSVSSKVRPQAQQPSQTVQSFSAKQTANQKKGGCGCSRKKT